MELLPDEAQAESNVHLLQRLHIREGERFSFVRNETEDSFTINEDRFVIKGLLGEGSFGSVYRCTRTVVTQQMRSEQDVAVKIVSTERISIMTGCSKEEVIVRMLSEADVLGTVGGHPHIVQMFVAAISPQSLRIFIVMQLLTCNDLFGEIVRRRQAFSEHDAREVTLQLVMAVKHCHMRKVAHRDIKLENVMVAKRKPLIVKLIDFGQAKVVDEMQQTSSSMMPAGTAMTLTTTHFYTPPEVEKAIKEKKSYDAFKLDTFGIGVVLYGLLCNALPDAAKGQDYEKRPSWKHLSADAQDLVKQLLNPDPQQRISIEAALEHSWLLEGLDQKSSCSKADVTPEDFDSELQALLTLQTSIRMLQRERGAACWMLASQDGISRWRWCCEASNECLHNFRDAISSRPCGSPDGCAEQMNDGIQRLREDCRCIAQISASSLGIEHFENVFSRYSKLMEDAIVLIGNMLVHLWQTHGGQKDDNPPVSELKLRMLLLAAEQLGRERAFISFLIGKPSWIRSQTMQTRFARIQGCRQMLLGSTSPGNHSEVISSSFGLLPGLGLMQEPLLSSDEIEALEAAESTVMEGKGETTEWFSLLTSLINHVHRHASMAIVEFVDEFEAARSSRPGGTRSPSQQSLSSSLSLSQRLQTLTPASAASGSEKMPSTLQDPIRERTNSVLSSSQRQSSVASYGSDYMPRPMKVIPSSLPSTPEATPLHPGLFPRSTMPQLLPQTPQVQTRFMSETIDESSSSHSPAGSTIGSGGGSTNLATFTGSTSSAGFNGSAGGPSGGSASWKVGDYIMEGKRRVLISEGTIGHPHSCRGLGCKFALKKGCKEGAACPRCHLCPCTKTSEKSAVPKPAAPQPAAPQPSHLNPYGAQQLMGKGSGPSHVAVIPGNRAVQLGEGLRL
eukprot:TRINITY_DN40833_c0_g1_i1.p1 TRINITY_DN40833_c0_g1~~TRINITY_DN40833_c0_g1_i1.p1  ORF type:complete len:901 (+),score=161.53 TRINITY_DN40833_c0_g1_i1:82-2784(+)